MEEVRQQFKSDRYDPLQDSYDTVRLRLDPSPFLLIIRSNLLRRKYNPENQKWEDTEAKPLFNKDGVDDLMTELEARLTIYSELSLVTEAKVNQIVREIGEICFEFIFYQKEKYAISVEDFRRIVHLVTHNVDLYLRRALGGRENQLLSKQFSYTENSSVTQQLPSQGAPPQGTFSMFGRGSGHK
jgi:hypothetical protein